MIPGGATPFWPAIVGDAAAYCTPLAMGPDAPCGECVAAAARAATRECRLAHRARRMIDAITAYRRMGEVQRIPGVAVGVPPGRTFEREHELGCDEYHAHRAPACCAPHCWCRE